MRRYRASRKNDPSLERVQTRHPHLDQRAGGGAAEHGLALAGAERAERRGCRPTQRSLGVERARLARALASDLRVDARTARGRRSQPASARSPAPRPADLGEIERRSARCTSSQLSAAARPGSTRGSSAIARAERQRRDAIASSRSIGQPRRRPSAAPKDAISASPNARPSVAAAASQRLRAGWRRPARRRCSTLGERLQRSHGEASRDDRDPTASQLRRRRRSTSPAPARAGDQRRRRRTCLIVVARGAPIAVERLVEPRCVVAPARAARATCSHGTALPASRRAHCCGVQQRAGCPAAAPRVQER